MRPGTDQRSRARSIAARALKSLRYHGLSPSPQNYELFYRYHEDSHPALTRDLDERQRAGEALDDATCSLLYQRYIARTAYERAIEKTGEELASIGERLGKEIDEAETSMRDPAYRIERLAARAATTDAVAELKDLMALALAEARVIVDIVKKLEHRLRMARTGLAAVTEAFLAAKQEAELDPLTGLPNRRRFERAVAHALQRLRSGGPASLLLLVDIDHFKEFNDRHGHLMGDLVLRAVAQLLRRNVKEEDLVTRWGGEEFAILLQPRSLSEGCKVAERLRRTIGSRRIRQRSTGQDLGTVTLSIGIGEAATEDTPEKWIERVDRALYCAKRRGRDCVVVADPPQRHMSPAEIVFTATDDDALAAATCVPPAPAEQGRR